MLGRKELLGLMRRNNFNTADLIKPVNRYRTKQRLFYIDFDLRVASYLRKALSPHFRRVLQSHYVFSVLPHWDNNERVAFGPIYLSGLKTHVLTDSLELLGFQGDMKQA